jgi:hypothetical protein
MKRHRTRKAQGIVLTPPIHISSYGVKLLAQNGWLEPDAPIDSEGVGDALRKFINASLKPLQKPKQEPKRKLRQAVRSVTAWLL